MKVTLINAQTFHDNNQHMQFDIRSSHTISKVGNIQEDILDSIPSSSVKI